MSENVHHCARRLGSWIVIGIIASLIAGASPMSAQNDDNASSAQPATTPGPELNPNLQPPSSPAGPAAAAGTAQSPSEEANSQQQASSYQQPPVPNLETGLPLRTTMSPLHWGHLSLLSFTAFEGYSSAYQFGQSQVPASGLTALQALAIYSIQRSKTSFDLQYNPYVWFTPQTTYKDFAANSVNLNTAHVFSRAWTLTLADAFRYSPQMANTLGGGYSADFASGLSNSNPFLALGEKYWTNDANINVDHQLGERSHLIFNATDDYIRISGMGNGLMPGQNPSFIGPFNEENMYGGGVTWNRQWSTKNTLLLSYNYRRQQTPLTYANTNYHLLDVGYSRVLTPTVTFSIQGGPGFLSGQAPAAQNGTTSYRSTTAQGSVTLMKAFRYGGIAVSANRDVDYSGIISDNLNNRYDVTATRRFATRWTLSLTGSYVQQEFVGQPTTDGELGWGELNCHLSRMWSVFGGYRYFRISGPVPLFAPKNFASLGIRWAWDPEVKN